MQSHPSERFSQWVEQMIADPSAGECLPPIRELASSFGISLSSIQSRLKPFVADGRLTAIRGRGTFVTLRMSRPSQPVELRGTTSAESIADAVIEDIASGKLKHGDPLPPIKLLCSQFKTGHAAVTRAYRILQQRGLTRRVGRSFWVGGLQSIRSFGARRTVPCFNYTADDPADMTADTEMRRAFEAMEHELHNHRMSIRFEDPAKLDLLLRPRAFSQCDYPGIIISGIREEDYNELYPRLESLGPMLKRSGKRILICAGHLKKQKKKVHYFCHGTIITHVVRTAADACFTRGFQDIALLFNENESTLTGLRFFLRFISEFLLRSPRARVRLLIQTQVPHSSPESIFKRMPTHQITGNFEYLEGLLSKYTPITMNELYEMTTVSRNLGDLLAPLPKGSVWLTTSAATAHSLVQWCGAHHVPIPAGAAIVCFEDHPSLSHRGIASCIPDWSTIGYLMAHAVIGDIPLKRSRRGFLRTPAVLYERDTMP